MGSRIEITWTIFRQHLAGVKNFDTHLTPYLNDPSLAIVVFDSFMTWKSSLRSSNPVLLLNQMKKKKVGVYRPHLTLQIPESSSSYPNLHLLKTFLGLFGDFFVEVAAPRFFVFFHPSKIPQKKTPLGVCSGWISHHSLRQSGNIKKKQQKQHKLRKQNKTKIQAQSSSNNLQTTSNNTNKNNNFDQSKQSWKTRFVTYKCVEAPHVAVAIAVTNINLFRGVKPTCLALRFRRQAFWKKALGRKGNSPYDHYII